MSYDENKIKVFRGLEGVRNSPSMYIGKPGKHAILHMLREIVENCVDEYTAGKCKIIKVKVSIKNGKQIFTIADNGRGIPVGVHKSTGISTLTTILTELHSGGKFDAESYETSRGTHGVGTSVVNALSSNFKIYTYRAKKWYYQAFKAGIPQNDVKIINTNKIKLTEKGTIIQFIPDSKIFKNSKLDIKEIRDYLYNVAYLNPKLKVELISKKVNEIFYNKEGPSLYLKELIKNYNCKTIGKPFILETKSLILAVQWSDSFCDDGIKSFVSSAGTKNGGTHVKGLNDSITYCFRQLKQKKHKYSAQDLKIGLIGFINYKTSRPEFNGQTKDELVALEATKEVKKIVNKHLIKFLNSNKKLATDILNKVTLIENNRKKLKDSVKKASKLQPNNSKSLLPGKLLPALSSTKPKDKELFIVEGDSAKGTASDARDPKYQEVLALKGKPINAGKESLHRVLINEEVLNILLSIGWTQVDIKKFIKNEEIKPKYRIGKIFITADADVDGKHIENLICTLLFFLDKNVFNGMLYLVRTPLYRAIHKDKSWFGDSIEQLKTKVPKQALISRFKGLGEVNFEELKKFAFNPKTRRVIKVKLVNKTENKIKFLQLVGKDTKHRKEMLGI